MTTASSKKSETARRKKPETARRKKRRDEIYDVAIAVFNRKGYATASVQEIADEIGVLKGSLYYYIDSKEDLLQGIFAQTDREFLELIDEALALEVPELERLRRFARAWCLWYLENIERARIYVNDWTHLTGERLDQVAEMRKEYGRRVQDIINRAIAEQGLELTVDPDFARLYVFSAVNGLPMWYRREGAASAEKIADAYSTLIVGTVLCTSLEAE